MKELVSNLLGAALRGLADAEKKIMDYLLLKGTYVQPLRMALEIRGENAGSGLYNTISPYLLDAHYLFEISERAHDTFTEKSVPLSTKNVFSEAYIQDSAEIKAFDEPFSVSGPSLENEKENKHANSLEAQDQNLPNSSEESQVDVGKPNRLKKKKHKKNQSYTAELESSPFIAWLNLQKSLRPEGKKKKIKEPSKYKKIQESAQKSILPSQDIISEPLARILVTQGHLLEAKKMYKGLISKYPEQSTLFEKEIEEINKLIDSKD